jgi:hypothetical protein
MCILNYDNAYKVKLGVLFMIRLIARARRHEHAYTSKEIDDGFNEVVGVMMHKARGEREQREKLERASREAAEREAEIRLKFGNPYTLRGRLNTDERPIPLEKDIRAHNDNDALKNAQKQADNYRTLENYGVTFAVFREDGTPVGSVCANPVRSRIK